MAEFVCHLKKYRQMAGLTQEDLALKIGVRRKPSRLRRQEQSFPEARHGDFRAVRAPIEEISF